MLGIRSLILKKIIMKKLLPYILACFIYSLFSISNAQAQKNASCSTTAKIPKIKGVSYHEARKLLLKEDWVPAQAIYPKSKTPFNLNIVYESFKNYPEVQGCSGTGLGFCTMFFTNQDYDILVITTAGQDDPANKSLASVTQIKSICN